MRIINRSQNNIIFLIIKSVLLAIGAAVFPILYLFLPALFITESIKSGIVKIMGIFSLICLMLGFVTNPLLAAFIFSLFGPMILIFHYMISQRYKVDTTLFVCAGVFFLSILVACYAIGINFSEFKSAEYINAFLNVQKEMMTSLGLEFNRSNLIVIYKRSLQIMPAMLIIVSIIVAYVTFIITGRSLIKRGEYIIQPSSFIFLRLPRGLVRALLVSALVSYLVSYLGMYDFNIIFDNIFLIFYSLFVFVGISLLMFFISRRIKNSYLTALLLIIIFFIPGSGNLFALAGAVDYILNLRGLA